jgi:hypothetical protein
MHCTTHTPMMLPSLTHRVTSMLTLDWRASSASKRDLMSVYSLLRTMASWLRTWFGAVTRVKTAQSAQHAADACPERARGAPGARVRACGRATARTLVGHPTAQSQHCPTEPATAPLNPHTHTATHARTSLMVFCLARLDCASCLFLVRISSSVAAICGAWRCMRRDGSRVRHGSRSRCSGWRKRRPTCDVQQPRPRHDSRRAAATGTQQTDTLTGEPLRASFSTALKAASSTMSASSCSMLYLRVVGKTACTCWRGTCVAQWVAGSLLCDGSLRCGAADANTAACLSGPPRTYDLVAHGAPHAHTNPPAEVWQR